MSLLSLFALAVALAMDAFAVALSSSASLKSVTAGHYLRMSLAFGLFQAFMPIAGWVLGLSVRGLIEAWDHWIAFGLLAFVGLNMLRDAFSCKADDEHCGDPSHGITLLLLAVATSIDALAVGLSFSVVGISVWFPALVIGLVCALLTALGIWLGARLGCCDMLGGRASAVGALVLIGIGVKILHEHGVV